MRMRQDGCGAQLRPLHRLSSRLSVPHTAWKALMSKSVDLDRNPLTHWDGPLGLPDFPRIDDDGFGPVFDAAFAAHRADIDAIADNPEKPTIENTFAAMELAGDPLD